VHPRKILWIATLALASPWCTAQAVYRCGNSYSQAPCEGATTVAAPHVATRTEAAQATKAAQVDAKRADAMEKARLAQEKNAPKAIVIGPAQPPLPAASAKRVAATKPHKPEVFTAIAPGTAKPKKKK
jgi:hypothetical protein